MRVELLRDDVASRVLHCDVMNFQVYLADGEQMTPALEARVDAMAASAHDAWETVHAVRWFRAVE